MVEVSKNRGLAPAYVYIPPRYRSLLGEYGCFGKSLSRDLIFICDDNEYIELMPLMEYLLVVAPPSKEWQRADRLKLVQVIGTGIDHLYPLQGLREKAVVANSSGVNARAVAEVGLGLSLVLRKGYARLLDAQRERRWIPHTPPAFAGTTMVILGCGRIGMELAAMAQPLGIGVRGTWNRPAATVDGVRIFPSAATVDLMSQADVVVVLLPFTEANRNFLGRDKLMRMKPGAVLVNLGRGGIVDEEALVDLLKGGQLSGAAMDVFKTEPLRETSPLWNCPGLIVSPHIAGAQDNQLDQSIELFLRNIEALETGRLASTAIDLAKGY